MWFWWPGISHIWDQTVVLLCKRILTVVYDQSCKLNYRCCPPFQAQKIRHWGCLLLWVKNGKGSTYSTEPPGKSHLNQSQDYTGFSSGPSWESHFLDLWILFTDIWYDSLERKVRQSQDFYLQMGTQTHNNVHILPCPKWDMNLHTQCWAAEDWFATVIRNQN